MGTYFTCKICTPFFFYINMLLISKYAVYQKHFVTFGTETS